ncbi:reverse transcriptase domain-containing protein [Tanacetum coccineum]
MVVRIMKQGYCWPSMHQDVAKVLQNCKKCKEQSAIWKVAESSAMTTGSGWPFSHWGINILGPLPTALKGFKFLAIAIEHSTKWVEAKPLPIINGRHADSLTYGFEGIIPIPKNDVAKDDRGRIKEVDKIRGNKEIASIEEA